MIPVSFGALAMSMGTEVVFGCMTTVDYLTFGATLLEEYFSLVGKLET